MVSAAVARRDEAIAAVAGLMAAAPSVAHAFWHDDGEGGPELPRYAAAGLESAGLMFSLVVLWAYAPRVEGAGDVFIADADALLPRADRDALRAAGAPFAHVADVVRFRAAARLGGWVIDADNFWLRSPPVGRFVFSTVWAKATGSVAPRSEASRVMFAAFAKENWDGRGLINTPFCVVAETPFAAELDALCERFCVGKQPRAWNIFMHGVRDLVLAADLGAHVRPPLEYGAAPFWGGQRGALLEDGFFDGPAAARTKFGVTFPTTDEILERAYCVPTSFALGGKAGVHSAIDPRAFAREHPTSLLGRVVAAIWPSDDA